MHCFLLFGGNEEMNDEMCVVVAVNDIIKKRRLLMWLECSLLNVLWDIYIYI